MSNIKFEEANVEDASILTTISKEAFHTDINVGGRSLGGPPGYDSIEFYKKMIQISKAFYKILMEDQIIGGFFIFYKEPFHCELGRIFIDPKFHQKGFGIRAMKFLFNTYKNIKKWSLNTPIWNTRTINFYQKCGFKIIKKNSKELLFERNI
ncbi:MAG: GNAT family N-acetyltransferase [Spirochaetales bacterium]|nr:GNAT family N-acetyltransferase [Spirochaetales bacterium]